MARLLTLVALGLAAALAGIAAAAAGAPDLGGLMQDLARAGAVVRDVTTSQNTLEEIFVDLVSQRA